METNIIFLILKKDVYTPLLRLKKDTSTLLLLQ
jgi:hypothetical protein